MAGLFADPAAVAIAEQQALRQAGSAPGGPQAVAQGSFFNLGNTAGGAAVRGFGGDSRSASQKRAAQLQSMAKGIDFKNPNSIIEGANRLNEAGFQGEALKLMTLIPPPVKAGKTFGPLQSRSDTIEDDSGNRTNKKTFFQEGSDGSFNSRFSLTSSGELETGGGVKLKSQFLSDIDMDKDSREAVQNRIFSAMNSEQFSDLDDISEVQQKGIEAQALRFANERRQQEVAELSQLVDGLSAQGTQLSQLQFDALARQVVTPGPVAIAEATNQLIESGDFRRFMKAGGVVSDPEVTGSPGGSDVSLAEAQNLTLKEQKKKEAIQKVADKTGKLVFGDPRDGEFNIVNLRETSQAPQRRIFQDVLSKVATNQMSPEMALQSFTNEGFTFGEESLPTHLARWDLMANNQVFANTQLSRLGNFDEFESQGLDDLRRMEAAGEDFTKWAESQQIYNYLLNMANTNTAGKASGRGRGRIGGRGRTN